MKPNFGPSEPKPFALVPIPSEAPRRDRATTHEQFMGLTGQLELTFAVVSEYLFVGSGGYEFNLNAKRDQPDVWHTFYHCSEQVCVPATSLKGTIRSIVEAISNSCISQARRGEPVDGRHQRCEFKSPGGSKLCPACRLFGATGLRGRAYFVDALPKDDVHLVRVKIAELWEPKRAVNARRFYEVKEFERLPNSCHERNHRFVEAAPKNTRFQTTLHFENLGEPELGLLFYALGWQPADDGFANAFTPKLGGAKPRCFGAVRFEPERLRLWRGRDWQAWFHPQVKQGDELTLFVRDCLMACRKSGILLHESSWRRFVSKMQPSTGPCPRGVY